MGTQHTVTITGQTMFRGLLLYVTDAGGNRIGSFATASNTQHLTQGCPANVGQTTLSHNSNSGTTMFAATSTFTWTSPSTIPTGNIAVQGIAYTFPGSRGAFSVMTLAVPRAANQTNGPTTTAAGTTSSLFPSERHRCLVSFWVRDAAAKTGSSVRHGAGFLSMFVGLGLMLVMG